MKSMRWTIALLLLAGDLYGSSMNVLLGPPSVGQGGSNPLSIPPFNPGDWQFTYLTAANREYVLSIFPGLFYGQRWYADHFYASLGAGFVTSTGLGLGVSHALGYETEEIFKSARVQAEYRQTIGIDSYGWQFPYSLRMGLSYEF